MQRMIHFLGQQGEELRRGRARRLQLTLGLPLSQGEVTLPPGDTCPAGTAWIRIPHPTSGELLLFRPGQVETKTGAARQQTITLEDPLTLLQGTAIPGYVEVGGTTLRAATAHLLTFHPGDTVRLGDCPDIPIPIHGLENTSLLSALLTLIASHDDLHLALDTVSAPWVLHVKSDQAGTPCEVRLTRNVQSLTITEDRAGLITQLIPLGYGEGADQLTIRTVNGGEMSLVADTAAAYGLIQAIWVDRSITHAAALKEAGQAILNARCRPRRTIRINGNDIFALTGEKLDAIRPGVICRLALPEMDMAEAYQVQAVTWGDAVRHPTQVEVTLGQPASLTQSLKQMGAALRTASHCSQGAPSQYVLPFQDNADPEHPAVLPFFLDRDTLHVNDLRLMISLRPFRAYSRSARAGGAATATTEQYVAQERTVVSTPPQDTQGNYARYTDAATAEGPDTSHRHHYNHVHRVPIILQLPALKVRIPAHSHDLAYGVYEGSTATSVQVLVDGQPVSAAALQGSGGNFSLDAAPYLRRDAQGRITRGSWHEITLIPDQMTRIHAAVYVRSFLRSLTGRNL